jgi:hypothetical protein
MTTFNFEDALKQLQSGKKLTGTDGILTPLIKQLTEAALQAELEQHLNWGYKPETAESFCRDWLLLVTQTFVCVTSKIWS